MDKSGSRLTGACRLTAAYVVIQGTSERRDLYGARPRGFAVFEPNGRLMALLMSSGRQPADSDPGRTALFQSMMAYSGKFSLDTDRFVTKVDLAWDPGWEGTEQVRYYILDNDRLSLRTAPIHHPSFPGPQIVAYVDWEREA